MAQSKSVAERLKELNVDRVRKISIDSVEDEVKAETRSRRSRKRSEFDIITELDVEYSRRPSVVTFAEGIKGGGAEEKCSRSKSLPFTGVDNFSRSKNWDDSRSSVDSNAGHFKGYARSKKPSSHAFTGCDGFTGYSDDDIKMQSMTSIAEEIEGKARTRRSSSLPSQGRRSSYTEWKDEDKTDKRRKSMSAIIEGLKGEAKHQRKSSLPFTGCLETFAELQKEAERAAYEAAFKLLDIDGNKEITREDLTAFLTNMNEQTSESEVTEMIKMVDEDGNGSINFNEFYRLMKKDEIEKDSEEDMVDAFQVFDSEHNGFLPVDDLKRIMLDLGDPITEDELADLIHEIDLDHDGLINYNEFINVINR